MKVSELPVVAHEHFGTGFVLGERIADVGPLRDVFFLDEKVRAVLPGYLTDAAKPDTAPKALRAAFSAYRKAHRKPRATADSVTGVPEPQLEGPESEQESEPDEVFEIAELN